MRGVAFNIHLGMLALGFSSLTKTAVAVFVEITRDTAFFFCTSIFVGMFFPPLPVTESHFFFWGGGIIYLLKA